MFGLSTRTTYRPLTPTDAAQRATTPGFRDAYVHIFAACERLVSSGRVRRQNPGAVAAQLWSFVHGFITLEFSNTFMDSADPVRDVMMPMGVNLSVGLGDSPDRARHSHLAAATRHA